MASATITSKGQITIPKKIRDRLGLHTGDQVSFVMNEDGRVTMQPASLRAGEIKGILHRKGRRIVSVEQMNAAVTRRLGAAK
jgi:AbrB family looped-hinge helix DNA binding protein